VVTVCAAAGRRAAAGTTPWAQRPLRGHGLHTDVARSSTVHQEVAMPYSTSRGGADHGCAPALVGSPASLVRFGAPTTWATPPSTSRSGAPPGGRAHRHAPGGPIAVLTTCGVGLAVQSITCYFCYDERRGRRFLGSRSPTRVARAHTYVVGPPAPPLDKELHVSPFSAWSRPTSCATGARRALFVGFSVREGGSEVLSASMALRRQPLDRARRAAWPGAGLGAPGSRRASTARRWRCGPKVSASTPPGKAGVR